MEYYASVIQKVQNELGLRVGSFHNIGLSSLKFYSSKCITLLLFHSDRIPSILVSFSVAGAKVDSL